MYLAMTLTIAVPVAFLSSVTVNSNIVSVSEDIFFGAVNVAMGLFAPFNVTGGPPV